MLIGLLTLPLETGYGSIMQAYALKKVLTKEGHNVTLIRRLIKRDRYNILNIIKRFVKKYIFRQNALVFYDKKVFDEFPIITKNTRKFIDKHLAPYTEDFFSSFQFKKLSDYKFEAIVIGSDQVWRQGCMENVSDYFLPFIDTSKTKLISYAASFGQDYLTYSQQQIEIAKSKLKEYCGISVREHSGVDICKKTFEVNATLVLDPTMLLSKEDYFQLIENHEDCIRYETNVTAFILDRTFDKQEAIKKVCKALDCGFNWACNNTEDRFASLKDRIAPSVSDWLKAMYYAKFIITDSFHGCVFCIIFNKPFVLYVNKDRGTARFDSLFSLFNLKHRVIYSSKDIDRIDLNEFIDWSLINQTRDDMKTKSLLFLKTYLK